MKYKIIRAFTWDFFGSIIGYFINIISSFFLARLITPEEFGILALCIAPLAIFNLIIEFGFTKALIQNSNNTFTTYSSVFIFNLCTSIIFFTSTIFISSHLASFYNYPVIKKIFPLISITLIFYALSIVPKAIFYKKLDFRKINIISFISSLVGSSIGITMAYNNLGLYALVGQYFTTSLINFVLTWKLSLWRPYYHYTWKSIQPLFNYGKFIFLSQLLNQIILTLDNLLIGKLFSTEKLGYYSKASSLVTTINSISVKSIVSIFFSLLSSLQNNKALFIRIYFLAYLFILASTFGLAGIILFLSKPIILYLYGNQWYQSIPYFEILILKLLTFPVSSFLIIALLSQGFSKEDFKYSLIKKGMRISSYIIAFYYSLKAFLITSVVIGIITIIYNSALNSHYLNISFRKHLQVLFRISIIFLISLLITRYVFKAIINHEAHAILYSITFAIFYFSIFIVFNKKEIKEIHLFFQN